MKAGDALQDFRGLYGRYLVLAAQEMRAHGGSQKAVLGAATRNGHPVAVARDKANRAALALIQEGFLPTDDVARAMNEALWAVQEEWDVDIPTVGP